MTSTTADLCDRHEAAIADGRVRILPPMFRSFGGRSSFAGQVMTLKLFEDNSYVRKAVETPGGGRILAIDGGGSLRRALVGDQLAALAARNGWSGIIANGCIRDSAAIVAMDLGVLALATHPQKTDKKNVGEMNIPISIGGVVIRPDEWVYADGDGVVVSATPLD